MRSTSWAATIRGDPASALLEVLDGEQNSYLPGPLPGGALGSEPTCMFITTANTHPRPFPGPLLDRMEVIELTSYTDEEKLQIAKRHLLPKQLKRARPEEEPAAVSATTPSARSSPATPGSPVSVMLERELAHAVPEGRHAVWWKRDVKRVTITAEDLQEYAGRAPISARSSWSRAGRRWAWSTAWPGPRWAASCWRWRST